MSFIECIDISKHYKLDKVSIQALDSINLSIELGEMVGLMGPSGSGKSSLLNIIGGIDTPTTGRILVGNQDLSKLNDRKLCKFRNQIIGFIFQTFHLIPVFNVYENIEYPLILQKIHKNIRKQRVMEIAAAVEIENHIKRKPYDLSGGERQRVAIARALVTNPKLIIADEPTANLDHKTGQAIMDLISALNKELKTGFIFSTHDPLIVKYANRIIYLADGKLSTEGMNHS